VELAATRQERRRQLLQQYFFDIDDEQKQQQQLEAPIVACITKQLHYLPADSAQGQVHQMYPCSGSSFSEHQRSSVELLAYGSSSGSSPPWPTDPADRHLCGMDVLLPSSIAQAGLDRKPRTLALESSSGGGSSSSSGHAISSQSQHCPGCVQHLPGGICLLPADVALQQSAALRRGECSSPNSDAPESADDCDNSVRNHTMRDAEAAASLFADLQGLELTADLSNIDDYEMLINDAGRTAQHCSEGSLSMPSNLQGGHGVVSTTQEQQQQSWQAVQWGDWGSALASVQAAVDTGGAECISAAWEDLVDMAACVLVQIQQLHQQGEQASRQGQTAAAVQLYQQALGCADGLVTQPRSQTLSSAAAFEAADSEGPAGYGNVCKPANDAGRGATCLDGHDGSPSRVACQPTLGPRHILRLRLAAGLLKVLVDQGADWKAAYAVANALTPLYELVYPKVGCTGVLLCASYAQCGLSPRWTSTDRGVACGT